MAVLYYTAIYKLWFGVSCVFNVLNTSLPMSFLVELLPKADHSLLDLGSLGQNFAHSITNLWSNQVIDNLSM